MVSKVSRCSTSSRIRQSSLKQKGGSRSGHLSRDVHGTVVHKIDRLQKQIKVCASSQNENQTAGAVSTSERTGRFSAVSGIFKRVMQFRRQKTKREEDAIAFPDTPMTTPTPAVVAVPMTTYPDSDCKGIMVVGAGGRLGSAVCQELLNRGKRVVGVVRGDGGSDLCSESTGRMTFINGTDAKDLGGTAFEGIEQVCC